MFNKFTNEHMPQQWSDEAWNQTARDLKDFSGRRIIKDEPNYSKLSNCSLFTPNASKCIQCWKIYYAPFSPEPKRVLYKPITRKLCNHRSLLLLFIRFIEGEKILPACLPKSAKTCNWWVERLVSSLKSRLRVAVVREIYGRKFIYNFS